MAFQCRFSLCLADIIYVDTHFLHLVLSIVYTRYYIYYLKTKQTTTQFTISPLAHF